MFLPNCHSDGRAYLPSHAQDNRHGIARCHSAGNGSLNIVDARGSGTSLAKLTGAFTPLIFTETELTVDERADLRELRIIQNRGAERPINHES
jgi:hypothetical protein